MAIDFNSTIFGSPINPKVENKLRVRQALAESSNPNESIDLKPINGKTLSIKETLGRHNYQDNSNNGFIADLSSRTPWARMWVAIEIYKYTPEKKEQNIEHRDSEVSFDGSIMQGGGRVNIQKAGYKTYDKIIQEEKTETMEKKVYILGDNNYDILRGGKNELAPIQGKHSVLDSIGVSADKIFTNELENNPLLKPHSGIVGVSSKTEGPYGAIKYTTISFIVHNFDDYQNIYSKFFLKPGATVFVDFGWDTSQIYDPQELIASGENPITQIYGTDGPIENSAGDLDVIVGKVSEFTTNTDSNGSFICELTLISDNAALVDYEISDRNKLKSKMVDNLNVVLINKMAENLGEGFAKDDWTSDKLSSDGSIRYANSFANKLIGGHASATAIPDDAIKLGLYWKSFGEQRKDFVVTTTGEETSFFSTIDDPGAALGSYQTEGEATRGRGVVALSDDNNLYVSWGFLEEELLNKELGFVMEAENDFGAHFDSTNSFITFEKNLIDKQNTSPMYIKRKNGLKFLYPPHWRAGETYDTINHNKKRKTSHFNTSNPLYEDATSEQQSLNQQYLITDDYGETAWVNSEDVKQNRMPLRELFVNTTVISDAFSNAESVSDAIMEILDELNSASSNVFKLRLVSGKRDGSTLSIIDENFSNTKNQITHSNKFDNLFNFRPYSKGSIVKEMSLNFKTPNNAHQTIIAIQNKSVNIPLFPRTDIENQQQALRLIYNLIDNENSLLSFRHLPALNTKGKNDDSDDAFTNVIQAGLDAIAQVDGDGSPDEVIDAYKNISEKALKYKKGEGDAIYRGIDANVDAFDEDTDNDNDSDEDGYSKEPEDLINPDAIYVKDIDSYYEHKLTKGFVHDQVSPIIPIELQITTYGISGIVPGDIFNIDYLPSQYHNRTFFQVTNVEQQLNTGGWETKIDTILKVRADLPMRKAFYKTPKKVFLSRTFLDTLHINPRIGKAFKNFQLSKETQPGILVFNVEGRINGKYKAAKTFNKFDSLSKFLRPMIVNSSLKWTVASENYRSPKIELDKKYQLILVLGGGIALAGDVNLRDHIDEIKDRLFQYFVVNEPIVDVGGMTTLYSD